MKYAVLNRTVGSFLRKGSGTVCVPLAQLDRVSDSDSEGRAFESRMARHHESP